MKVFHRIRCHLIVLLVMLHCATAASPPSADFSKCGVDKSIKCMAHEKDCFTSGSRDNYEEVRAVGAVKTTCSRFLIMKATGSDQVEIEFRDDKFAKNPGVTFLKGIEQLFECRDNVAKKLITNSDVTLSDISNGQQYDKTYCKFTITETNNIVTFMKDKKATVFKDSNNLNSNGIELYNLPELVYPCNWNKPIFTRRDNEKINVEEEEMNLEVDGTKRICREPFFNRYSLDTSKWEIIGDFSCEEGVIKTTKRADHSIFEINLEDGLTKCTRPRCAACECKFCNANATGPQFVPSDGNSCAMIKCNNTDSAKMLVTTSTGISLVHLHDTLTCEPNKKEATQYETSTWGKIATWDEVTHVECVSEVKCTELNPIVSVCPDPETISKEFEGRKECKNATLKNDGASVCDGADAYYKPNGENVKPVKCDGKTGKWEIEKLDGTKVTVQNGDNVYCLKNVTTATKAPKPQKGGLTAGGWIGIILGASLILIIIIVIVVFCMRNHFKKKGNREEMKSVSVTGKKSRKGKGKKGKTSSTATSEISAPAPPPCPDSLNIPIEPEPPLPPPSGGPPSSGGPASAPVVGPDTGKPDKPAELIDIKLESEKKKSEKENTTKKDPEPSVANTVTGTSFDKSGVGSVKNTKDATDTKKDKNGESARSDTGRHTTEATKKKKKPIRGKDGELKVQLDKNGQGLTDDDDFNIDEGAKPVNADDKNRKAYKPKEDPRKKMINVTMTEDEDGKLKPRRQQSLF